MRGYRSRIGDVVCWAWRARGGAVNEWYVGVEDLEFEVAGRFAVAPPLVGRWKRRTPHPAFTDTDAQINL